MRKIIFVCTGGTCRSPMAEFILKHKLIENKISLKDVNVSSAGLFVNLYEKINKNSILTLKKLKIKYKNKYAKQLNKHMVNKNTTIITLNNNFKEFLKNIPNVYNITDFNGGIDVLDPYGQSLECYEETAKILDIALNDVMKKIKEGKL